jgi:hypothetical protein
VRSPLPRIGPCVLSSPCLLFLYCVAWTVTVLPPFPHVRLCVLRLSGSGGGTGLDWSAGTHDAAPNASHGCQARQRQAEAGAARGRTCHRGPTLFSCSAHDPHTGVSAPAPVGGCNSVWDVVPRGQPWTGALTSPLLSTQRQVAWCARLGCGGRRCSLACKSCMWSWCAPRRCGGRVCPLGVYQSGRQHAFFFFSFVFLHPQGGFAFLAG